MTDLFPIPETPSPRLAWLKKHDVRTEKTVDEEFPWTAWTSEKGFGFGKTEDEAITNLAKSLNIPLWNEEGFKK